jgi:ssDNA-binding Zn-finger/Zn-ribbon topoisomerase 1
MTGEPEINKLCPRCRLPLEIRKNKRAGNEFLGCSGWPRCEHTEKLPEWFVMMREGADMLPGFEKEETK